MLVARAGACVHGHDTLFRERGGLRGKLKIGIVTTCFDKPAKIPRYDPLLLHHR